MDQRTPAPWVNVIPILRLIFRSRPRAAVTHGLDSRENQLMPRSNYPASDIPGEAIYVRKEAWGEVGTATALRDDASRYIPDVVRLQPLRARVAWDLTRSDWAPAAR